MIDKRHQLIGLLTVIVTCVAVMCCLPTDGLLKAVPLTLVILCLAIKRFLCTMDDEDNDDNSSLNENNNLKNE